MKKKIFEPGITCNRCGYYNHQKYVDKYGTCNLCGKVLDEKAKYKYEMVKRLYLWRDKKKGKKI